MNKLRICLLLLIVSTTAFASVKTACELGVGAKVYITANSVEIELDQNGNKIRLLSEPENYSQKIEIRKQPFLSITNSTDPRGCWGISSSADDDKDGLLNEDRLDNIDNDGDGLIDEDFAAIGNTMAVSNNQKKQNNSHIEVYYWSHSAYKNTVFISCNRPDGGIVTLNSTQDWHSAPLNTAQAEHFFATNANDKIVGAILLDQKSIPKSENKTVGTQFKNKSCWAITVADNAVSLRTQLQSAINIYNGTKLSSDSPPTRWIMSQGCAICVTSKPDNSTTIIKPAEFVFEIEVNKTSSGLINPDAFLFDGKPVQPTEIKWQPSSAEGWSISWKKSKASELSNLQTVLPYSEDPKFLKHKAVGKLVFLFSTEAPRVIIGKYLNNKTFKIEQVQQQHQIVEQNRCQPALKANLISNYPNPFREQTTISFDIPESVRDGLDWENCDTQSLDIDAVMPYKSTSPNASIRIYTASGREIALLENGSFSPGSYSTSWNGCNKSGRKVAVGAYFCKLQIEQWSVTKTVTVLR